MLPPTYVKGSKVSKLKDVCYLLTCDHDVEGLLRLVPHSIIGLTCDHAAPLTPGACHQQTETPTQQLTTRPQPHQTRVRRSRGRAPDQEIIIIMTCDYHDEGEIDSQEYIQKQVWYAGAKAEQAADSSFVSFDYAPAQIWKHFVYF